MSFISENPVLKELFEKRQAIDPDGNLVPMHSNIPRKYAEALHHHVLAKQPKVVLEIGMAFGVATLSILSALEHIGSGRLISIDPYQTKQWHGCGTANVARAGLAQWHQLLEIYDYLALPQLLADGLKLDFAYIDGWHTFDYTLLDFWYIDKMLTTRGTVAFNDCAWPGVHKTINFVRTHRKYKEVNVGLRRTISLRQGLKPLLTGLFSARHRRWKQDRYFEKLEDWEPNWDFFTEF